MMSAAFVLVGVFALGVWLSRRRYPGYLIYVISVMSMVRRWHFQLGIERLPVPDAWFVWMTFNALTWQVVATHYSCNFSMVVSSPYWVAGLIVIGLVVSIVSLPAQILPLPNLLDARHAAQFAVIIVAGLVALNGVWHSWRARSSDASLAAAAYAIAYVCGVIDYSALLNLRDAERLFLTPHSALVYALTYIFLLFRRYVRVMDEIETVNVSLEERVRTREAELAERYAHLREIEQRQTLSEERSRLMPDMHDGLGSALTSALRAVESSQGSEEEPQGGAEGLHYRPQTDHRLHGAGGGGPIAAPGHAALPPGSKPAKRRHRFALGSG